MNETLILHVASRQGREARPFDRVLVDGPSEIRLRRAFELSEALDALGRSTFDAILLDLELSDSQGLETLRAVKRAAPLVPVVVLVDPWDEALGRRALEEGARDCLWKGVCLESVLPKVVRHVVERARAEGLPRALLDGLSGHIAVLDPQGIILTVNQAWREFAAANQGNPERVCEGADYLAVCDAATGESAEGAREMAGAIRAMIAGESASFVLEYPCHCPDRERWFTARAGLVSSEGPYRVVVVHEEITERKRVEMELRQRQSELQALYDHAPFMLCLLDEHRRVVFANRSFAAYAGLDRDGCFFQIACGVLGCARALDDPRGCGHGPKCETCALRRAIVDTLETGRSHRNVEHTTILSDKDGTHEVVWLGSTARVPSADGPRVLLSVQDITEYRQAERDLRRSEARLRALYENSLVGILFTAPDGRVFNANPAACRILGRSEEEIRRLGRFGLLDPRDPNLIPLLTQRARTGTVQGTVTYLRGDGTRFPADTASVVFDTPEGLRTCTIIQDVTEREATAKRLRDFSRRLLTVREDEKRRLSAVLHHDVGSMSVGVGARLQAAEEDLRAGKIGEALEALNEGRRLFEEAVQCLKALALELRPPDLDILGLTAALRQHVAQLNRITPLRIRFTDVTHGRAIEPEIETALFRVVQESLTNVRKHAEADGWRCGWPRANGAFDSRSRTTAGGSMRTPTPGKAGWGCPLSGSWCDPLGVS